MHGQMQRANKISEMRADRQTDRHMLITILPVGETNLLVE